MDIPYTVLPRKDTGLWNAKVGIWLFLASEVMLFGALFSTYILLRVNSPETGALKWPHHLLNVPIGTFNTGVLIFSSITVILAWASLVLKNLKAFKWWMGITILCGLAFLGIKSREYYQKFTHYGVFLRDGTVITGHMKNEDVKLKEGEVTRYISNLQVVNGVVNAGPMKGSEIEHVMIAPDAPAGHGHEAAEHKAEKIEGKDIARIASYGPWYSPYFAIYFTLTGLHAIHVFGGMVVNTFMWGPGTKMYFTNPQRFTNRVEVAGLFWHFVDLVWIFLFPVLYLL